MLNKPETRRTLKKRKNSGIKSREKNLKAKLFA